MKGKFRRHLPAETLARLPSYRHQLRAMADAGEQVVSSRELASRLNVSDAQLRRDLSYLALMGRPGLGYEVSALLDVTSEVLGLDRSWSLAVIGAGSLGTALARYPGFSESQMIVRAIFDVSPRVIGQKVGAIPVCAMDELPAMAAEAPFDIAVLTVPAEHAQAALDRVVAAGVQAILNFTSVTLTAPPRVIVRNVDITSELQQLTYMLTHREAVPTP